MPGYINMQVLKNYQTPLAEDRLSTSHMLLGILMTLYITYALDHNTQHVHSTQHAAEAAHDSTGHPTLNSPPSMLAMLRAVPPLTVNNFLRSAKTENF